MSIDSMPMHFKVFGFHVFGFIAFIFQLISLHP